MPRQPIDHARALIEARAAGVMPPPEALAWAADGIALHLQQGVSLTHALGLVRYGGGGGHATADRRRQRDDLLRDVHRRYYVDLGSAPAADAIGDALARQKRARGRISDDLSQTLEVLVQFDPPVPESRRQLRKILALKSLF